LSKIPPVFTNKQGQQLSRKYEMWILLRRLKKDYEKQYTGYYEPTVRGYSDSFDKWLENTCGMKVYFDHEGNILGHFDISDEKLYAWMLLKYK
jgi:hypothetical protein